jgi:orotidine-5'-phosphate decarboxylase
MGFDSIEPYLAYDGKGAFLLCRTSNPGGDDLQNQRLASGRGPAAAVRAHVARLAQGPWNRNGQLGLVVGATYPARRSNACAACAHAAAADPRRGRAGRRCRGHRARRLAP